MAKVYITWLADVLREAGCAVREEGDWKNRDSPGDFQPIGVLWHHTAGPTASPDNPAPSLRTVRDTGTSVPPPLCHALIDYNGVFRLISAGNANHAGRSRGSGPIPAVSDANVLLVGWEIEYAAQLNQRMSRVQYQAALKGTAAVIRRLGKDASYVRGHLETSVDGKWDPGFIEMSQVRADVAALLSSGQPTPDDVEESAVQLLKANGVWYVVDFGAKTFWVTSSSTLLNYLTQTVGMRVMGDDYSTDILTGFTRI